MRTAALLRTQVRESVRENALRTKTAMTSRSIQFSVSAVSERPTYIPTMDGTILKEILRNCREKDDRVVYNWIDEKCDVERAVTYRELDEQTRKIAEELLQKLEVRCSERVILCYPSGLDFIISFIACLRAGITAGIVSMYIRILCIIYSYYTVAV